MQNDIKHQDLKVLIISENASNEFGGEAILPLNYFILLTQKKIDCYLITHERVKVSLRLIDKLDQDRIYYIRDTKLSVFLNKMRVFFPERIWLVSLGFLQDFFEKCQMWVMARHVVKEKKICVVHQPMPVSPKYPSMVFALSAPVVIGPMNGGMEFPEAFSEMASRTERYLYAFLRPVSTLINVVFPGKLFANLLLVANQRTENALPFFRLGKVKQLVENGVFAASVLKSNSQNKISKHEINVIFVGRMVDWKAIDIVIDAVHQSKLLNLKLMLIGDGPERPKLEKKVKDLNANNITFYGRVPFSEVNQYYDEADIFV